MSFERMGQAGMLEQPGGVLSRPVLMFPPHRDPDLVAMVQLGNPTPPKEESRPTAEPVTPLSDNKPSRLCSQPSRLARLPPGILPWGQLGSQLLAWVPPNLLLLAQLHLPL